MSFPVSGVTDVGHQYGLADFSGLASSTGLFFHPCSGGAETGNCSAPLDGSRAAPFLGQAFLCRDPGGADVLNMEMFSIAGNALVWLSQHPGAQDMCNLIVQYSPYDNDVDYIANLDAGVLLRIGSGSGEGRVIGVAAIEPSMVTYP
jgi:hypothetical protein